MEEARVLSLRLFYLSFSLISTIVLVKRISSLCSFLIVDMHLTVMQLAALTISII